MTDSQRIPGPLLIGLTGGIGAGKSTVASLFRDRGAAVVDADAIAREVVEPGSPALTALAGEFGDGVLTETGGLDRAALAAAAFASPERTAALNAIMHPAIGDLTTARLAELSAHPVVVHDVPLLVENGMTARYHLSVLVDVPEQIRLDRLTTTRGLDREDALRRIRAQADDAQRRLACDVLLDNSTSQEDLAQRFAALWERRIDPFRRHRAAGTAPAEPHGLTDEEASPAAVEAAGARLLARIDRAAAAASLACTGTRAAGRDGLEISLTVPDPDTASRLEPVLADLGFAPVPGAPARFAHADPGRPAHVVLRVSAGTR